MCRDLGQRVIELRLARGWTQEELADRVGVDVRDLRRIERGSNITVRMLVRVARGLAVGVGELFERPTTRHFRKPGRPKS